MLHLMDKVMAEIDFYRHKLQQADLKEQQWAEEVDDLKQQLNDQTATIEMLEEELQESEDHLALHHQPKPEPAPAVEEEDPEMIRGS